MTAPLAEIHRKLLGGIGNIILILLNLIEKFINSHQLFPLRENPFPIGRGNPVHHALQAAVALPFVDCRTVDHINDFTVDDAHIVTAIPQERRKRCIFRTYLKT